MMDNEPHNKGYIDGDGQWHYPFLYILQAVSKRMCSKIGYVSS